MQTLYVKPPSSHLGLTMKFTLLLIQQSNSEESKWSVAGTLMSNPNNNVDHIKYACGSLYNAGVDTTFSAIKSVMLCLLSNPECQERLHFELDSILGSPDHISRLPSFEE